MIKSISLKNFRGFKEHSVEFTSFCLLIGQNNAGKTTLIEALRILSVALQKAQTARFEMAPDSISPEITGPIFRFSVETLDIEQRGIHYNYETGEPALVKIRYKNNYQVLVAIGPTQSEFYCQLQMPGGKKVMSRSQASSGKFTPVFVMPPVGALLPEETQRAKRYLYKNINGYLSYRHIRNQMAEMPAEFARFKGLLTETWTPRLNVGDLEYGVGENANLYGLTIRDGPFVSEMALVGSGLQAWIQTLWFLSRVKQDAVVVLDEPDVYLHADLQKKLIKVLAAEKFKQTIVATHSLELIADVSPNEIINITKRAPRSKPLSSSAQAQSVVESLGTNLNIQLSKVASSGRILFVEGKDHAFLDQIAFKLGNVFYDKFSKIPHFSIGGMNNWRRAATTSEAFHQTSGGKVCSDLILDRDYKSENYLESIKIDASNSHLNVRFWSRKEIENFFWDASLITSFVLLRSVTPIPVSDILGLYKRVTDDAVASLTELIADSFQSENRKLALPTVMKMAKEFIATAKAAGVPDQHLISGKAAISAFSAAAQAAWNVQVSPMALCRHMDRDDIPAELIAAVNEIVAT